MSRLSLKILFHFIVLAAIFLLPGCVDDFPEPDMPPEPGLPATLRLSFQVADVKVNTRAADSGVNNIWIGIYNAETGECTYNKLYDNQNSQGEHIYTTLDDIATKSGRSHVVAVANVTDVEACKSSDPAVRPLADLLLEADTFSKYKEIVAVRNMNAFKTAVIVDPADETNILMSGQYNTVHLEGFDADADATLDIVPGDNAPDGAIHLRRIWAKNTFNIKASGDVVKLEVKDLQIFNVPRYSWVSARLQDNGIFANAGDVIDPASNGISSEAYYPSLRFTAPSEVMHNPDDSYTFSWWQYENKRTGKASTYADRDKFIKHNTGTEDTPVLVNANQYVFSSLAETEKGSLDNCATYVKINATVTYKDPWNNLDNPDISYDEGQIPLPDNAASRTANATYYVHLGYMDDDPADFNCHRNSDNTYNVTVRSVNQILVEAFSNLENQPGAEGSVTDVTDKVETLDAHYGCFNIYLTYSEMQSFSFTMRTYVNGALKMFYMDQQGQGNYPASNSDDFNYYNWIQLVPTGISDSDTKNEHTFAKYPGKDNTEKDKIYLPHQILTDIGKSTDRTIVNKYRRGMWFTVFVDEYAYGDDTNEKGTAWKTYVNQPDRQAWFNVAQYVSNDGNSIYYNAKYALRQHSIQTFYNVGDPDCKTALGLEHVNESFGQNMRFTCSAGADREDGRYNTWTAIKAKDAGRSWDTFLERTTQQYCQKISNTVQTTPAGINTAARYYPVIGQVHISESALSGSDGMYNGKSGSRDPQTGRGTTTQYLEAMYSCLNRNRDENGNGVIDQDELKWYLPATGEYLRIVLGRPSLSTPLVNFSQPNLPAGCGDDHNTLYHCISSDGKIVWLDEGMSSSNFLSAGAWSHAPWDIRCARELGTDLNSEPVLGHDPVETAYTGETSSSTHGGVVHVRRYYGTALREPRLSPFPIHKISSQYNKLSRYGFEIAPRGNDFNASSFSNEASAQYVNTDKKEVTNFESFTYSQFQERLSEIYYCKRLNESSGRKGWRLPNQKEMVIMFRLGVLSNVSDYYYYSGTNLVSSTTGTVCFATTTLEHWTNSGSNPGNSAEALSFNYRVCTVDISGGIACATTNNRIHGVRCVRDLIESENNKSYSELIGK